MEDAGVWTGGWFCKYRSWRKLVVVACAELMRDIVQVGWRSARIVIVLTIDSGKSNNRTYWSGATAFYERCFMPDINNEGCQARWRRTAKYLDYDLCSPMELFGLLAQPSQNRKSTICNKKSCLRAFYYIPYIFSDWTVQNCLAFSNAITKQKTMRANRDVHFVLCWRGISANGSVWAMP